jgi:hypothetical protein
MKLLIVNGVDPWVRSVSTVQHYVTAGRAAGHDVAVYGEPHRDLPTIAFTTDLKGVDLALFVIQVPNDLPDMPYLARLMDGIPRERRVVVDLWGRYNDTIRIEHDFNHLEKFDGNFQWDWEETYHAISATILQPTLAPLRRDAKSFLFHAFDPGSVVKTYANAKEAAAAWRDATPAEKPYGVMYAGANWQRWEQVRAFLESYGAARRQVGKACLLGWDWGKRPAWAVDQGMAGIDTDPAFLAGLEVETKSGVRFDQIVPLLSTARFVPIFHRPLFRKLNYVTVRSFETFQVDALPVLMLPKDFVRDVYGPAAVTLVPNGDIGAHLLDALEHPEKYWDALLKTRGHLAQHHSFTQRLQDLDTLRKGRAQ